MASEFRHPLLAETSSLIAVANTDQWDLLKDTINLTTTNVEGIIELPIRNCFRVDKCEIAVPQNVLIDQSVISKYIKNTK